MEQPTLNETPPQDFISFPSHTEKEQHEAWYNAIRAIVILVTEYQMKRSILLQLPCGDWIQVAKMWQSSIKENPYDELPPLETCGWLKDENGMYICDWECLKCRVELWTQ